jgi:hypothetical protein
MRCDANSVRARSTPVDGEVRFLLAIFRTDAGQNVLKTMILEACFSNGRRRGARIA